jgi:hypothetical protein
MITIETICKALEGAFLDATVWTESGYVWIDSPSEDRIIRISIDHK